MTKKSRIYKLRKVRKDKGKKKIKKWIVGGPLSKQRLNQIMEARWAHFNGSK